MLDEEGRIAEIGVRQRLRQPSSLIEEFMILANVAAAETLEERRMPCMYRVHDKPDRHEDGSAASVPRLHSTSACSPAATCAPRTSQRVARKGRPANRFERLVNETVLRSQSQAVYSPDNLGHFGLALRRYAHFTSPIRRYADLLVHRALDRRR